MRILSLYQVTPNQGGIETIIQHLDMQLSQKGHHVVTGLSRRPHRDLSWDATISHAIYGSAQGIVTARRPWEVVSLYHWLHRVFNPARPEVVISHDPLLVPLVKWIAHTSAGLPRFGIILYEHGMLSALHNRSAIYKQLYHAGLKAADRIVVGSEDYANALLSASKTPVVSIGAPIIFPTITVPRPLQGMRILYVDRLLRACNRLPLTIPWTLQLVGDGPDRKELHELSQSLHIADRCTWSGWQSDPWSVVAEATVLAFPSDFEGFGLVVGEALARGIPVLSTDCDFGPRTLIQNDLNGWLVPLNDQAFTTKLQDLVNGRIRLPDPSTVQDSVRQHSVERWAARLEEVCLDVVELKRRQESFAP